VGFVNNVLIIVVAIVVIVAIAIAWWAIQRRRTEDLRRRFGSEYDRTVDASRDQREAEADLRARQERVDALEIRPLQPADRGRYAERWREVQAMFVDDPGNAVEQADTLIGEVMRARGYPVGDFEQRAADISVNHAHVVDHYRTAHAIAVKRRSGEGATEQLRQAFVHYRALFADLLEIPDERNAPAEETTAASASPTATADRPATQAPAAATRGPAQEPATPIETEQPADPARRA
jgi:hypothetical protein